MTYEGAAADRFVPRSCGGWFKGKDPSVRREVLDRNWVSGAEVVYIGKANNLRRRLGEFAAFGAGKAVAHWGGRLIWQLADTAALRVAWRVTPEVVPVQVEGEMIAKFRQLYGQSPFANNPD